MSTPLDQFNSPDYKCKAYVDMMEDVLLMQTVLGGTKALRNARETHLPKQPREKPAEYEARIKRSVQFNATKKTSTALVGMVYKENPKLKESVPDLIKKHWENIDLAGSHGDVFTKRVFESAINDGHSFILVDMAKPVNQGATRADEMGRRPYWLHYTKDQAINWLSDRINGEEVLTQITFRECACVRVGKYGQKEVIRERTIYLPVTDDGLDENGIQVRTPVYGTMEWELHQEDPDAPEGSKFRLVDSGATKLPRIPYKVIYGKQTGFLTSEPLLLDFAYLNIDWWQQNSDYRTQLNKCVPILVRIGLPEEHWDKPEFVIGPGALIDLPATKTGDQPADLKYVAHDGTPLEATRQALMDTEQRMSATGISLIAAKGDREITLGEKKIDQGERTSDLATAARSLRDGIESALGFHAQYLNLQDQMGDGGAIDLGVADDDLILDAQTLTVLNNMVTQRRLTLETLHILMARGLKVDLTTEIEALKKLEPVTVPPPAQDQPLDKPDEMMNGGVQ